MLSDSSEDSVGSVSDWISHEVIQPQNMNLPDTNKGEILVINKCPSCNVKYLLLTLHKKKTLITSTWLIKQNTKWGNHHCLMCGARGLLYFVEMVWEDNHYHRLRFNEEGPIQSLDEMRQWTGSSWQILI